MVSVSGRIGFRRPDAGTQKKGQPPSGDCPSRLRVQLLPAGLATTAAAAAVRESTGALRLRPRLVDGEVPSAERVVVELGNRLLRILVCRHLDEREAARAASGLIAH